MRLVLRLPWLSKAVQGGLFGGGGNAQLIPQVKVVNRGGKTHTQIYWIDPETGMPAHKETRPGALTLKDVGSAPKGISQGALEFGATAEPPKAAPKVDAAPAPKAAPKPKAATAEPPEPRTPLKEPERKDRHPQRRTSYDPPKALLWDKYWGEWEPPSNDRDLPNHINWLLEHTERSKKFDPFDTPTHYFQGDMPNGMFRSMLHWLEQHQATTTDLNRHLANREPLAWVERANSRQGASYTLTRPYGTIVLSFHKPHNSSPPNVKMVVFPSSEWDEGIVNNYMDMVQRMQVAPGSAPTADSPEVQQLAQLAKEVGGVYADLHALVTSPGHRVRTKDYNNLEEYATSLVPTADNGLPESLAWAMHRLTLDKNHRLAFKSLIGPKAFSRIRSWLLDEHDMGSTKEVAVKVAEGLDLGDDYAPKMQELRKAKALHATVTLKDRPNALGGTLEVRLSEGPNGPSLELSYLPHLPKRQDIKQAYLHDMRARVHIAHQNKNPMFGPTAAALADVKARFGPLWQIDNPKDSPLDVEGDRYLLAPEAFVQGTLGWNPPDPAISEPALSAFRRRVASGRFSLDAVADMGGVPVYHLAPSKAPDTYTALPDEIDLQDIFGSIIKNGSGRDALVLYAPKAGDELHLFRGIHGEQGFEGNIHHAILNKTGGPQVLAQYLDALVYDDHDPKHYEATTERLDRFFRANEVHSPKTAAITDEFKGYLDGAKMPPKMKGALLDACEAVETAALGGWLPAILQDVNEDALGILTMEVEAYKGSGDEERRNPFADLPRDPLNDLQRINPKLKGYVDAARQKIGNFQVPLTPKGAKAVLELQDQIRLGIEATDWRKTVLAAQRIVSLNGSGISSPQQFRQAAKALQGVLERHQSASGGFATPISL